MTSTQEDKLNMGYAVISTCDKFLSIWTTNPVFSATYSSFKILIPLIEQNRDAQIVEITGVTTDKNAKKTIMIDKALFVANRVQSYATVAGNNELLENVSYSSSDLKKARDTDVVGICDTIASKANANVAALATYGITAAVITDLQTAITAYSTMISKPRTTRSLTKNATENLAVLFKQFDDLLTKRLDLDIEVFKTSKPDFYSQYQTARIIVSTGGSTSSVLGGATEKETGEPIKNVNFVFTPDNNPQGLKAAVAANGNGQDEVSKKTAEKGKFRIPNLPEGTYLVKIHKLGYKEQTISVNVVSNETTVIEVELEKV